MMRRLVVPVLAALSCLGGLPAARAAVVTRLSVDQRGDFALVGNVLAQNCSGAVPDPLVGDIGDCGDDAGDSGADVLWGSDAEGDALALASLDVSVASSVAVLDLPPGARVTHARVYWSALAGGADPAAAALSRDGVFSQPLQADLTSILIDEGDEFYQSSAEVTALVRARGEGAYRLSGIDVAELSDLESEVAYAAWWMVVFYELESEPLRNLTLFDGLELVSDGNSEEATLSGFAVPAGGFDAKLAVIAYEGDEVVDEDELRFGPSLPLDGGDALFGSDNFFDGSRLGPNGDALSIAGDLPRLSGEPGSASGLDLDIVDVTDRMVPGQTSARIQAVSDADFFLLAGFVTSVATFRPDLTTSVKSVRDVNGAPLRPGDELEYTVSVSNTGTDAAVELLLLDALPGSVSFVPGSLRIAAGANAGPLSDAADADEGEVERDANGETLVVRLGTGASATLGGRLDVGASSVVIYRVRVDGGASGSIENQAEISALGLLGGAQSVTPTDGNLNGPGAPPTLIVIDACATDADCTGAMAFCDVVAAPRRCVACVTDEHCTGFLPDCAPNRTCACVAAPEEQLCDGQDDDCDGLIDEGLAGLPCTIGTGACRVSGTTVCETTTSTRCDGVVPDCSDSDEDGLPDSVEIAIGTDPTRADSDDDGVPDGLEPDYDQDTDGDGLINALDADSDNDALRDGTELGLSCAPGASAETCVADADLGVTLTNPLSADTDGGGMSDGSEDFNLNGVQDDGETDPSAGWAADDLRLGDLDHDALSDGLEAFLEADIDDADSDNDGVPDGLEPNPSLDGDGDGRIGLLDPDADGDGLFDGTEMARGCDDPASELPPDTPAVLARCVPDADPATITSPLVADSDGGGVSDGREDRDGNGRQDVTESDPRNASDDGAVEGCSADDDCGAPESARVCEDGSCVLGCRQDDVSACPPGFACFISVAELGFCTNEPPATGAPDGGAPGDAGAAGAGSTSEPRDDPASRGARDRLRRGTALGGGACACRAGSRDGSAGAASLALLACFALARRGVRRSRQSGGQLA